MAKANTTKAKAKADIIGMYGDFTIQKYKGKIYASISGLIFVDRNGKPSKTPVPYDTVEEAKAAIEKVEVTEVTTEKARQ